MSADNGIFILHTSDGYRVANSSYSTVDSFDSPDGEAYMVYVFGDKPAFHDEETARLVAICEHKKAGWTEYGIVDLDYSSIEFPSLSLQEALKVLGIEE